MAGLMDKERVSDPIACAVPWTPMDAGFDMTKEEIVQNWKSNTCRPCGLYHAVVDKRWCKYRCEHNHQK